MLTTKLIYGCESFVEDSGDLGIALECSESFTRCQGANKNDVVLIECGVPSLKERAGKRQHRFIKSKLNYPNDPLAVVHTEQH